MLRLDRYWRVLIFLQLLLLGATRGARNPNPQVVITHASHVCSEHLFGLPLRINGMHGTQFNHARFDSLSRKTYAKHSNGAKAF